MLACGSYSPSNNKCEIYKFNESKWQSVASYPFATYIIYAPIIYHGTGFYIFGGFTSNTMDDNLIARLDGVTFSWTQVGELVQGRYGHDAIVVQGEILVVGGWSGSLKTERCSEIEGQMRCNAQEPELNGYGYYPELFAV